MQTNAIITTCQQERKERFRRKRIQMNFRKKLFKLNLITHTHLVQHYSIGII